MPSFVKQTLASPIGKNVFLRSSRFKTISWTLAEKTVPESIVDGWPNQKVLQTGTVLAKITSGPDTGKVGPFQGAGTAEVQTLTPTGTISGGTFTVGVLGTTTAAIQWNATAQAVADAINLALALAEIDAYVSASGGPVQTAAINLTFFGAEGQGNVAQVTINSSLTGTTPALTPTTATPGVSGAGDGRQTLTNIVGLCNTFLPWQLMNRDVEVAVIYEGAAVQGNCFEMTTVGLYIPVTNTTADAMFAKKSLNINWF